MKKVSALGLMAFTAFLSGCDANNGYDDLSAYMDEVRAKPLGRVEPLPQFTSYKAFNYSASGKRSPFQAPIKVSQQQKRKVLSNVKPDFNRVKDFLENFSFDAFSMVGSLSDDAGFWALVAANGSVYRVQVNDYLGKNHGRIVGITASEIQVLEIVRSGANGWVERPRTLPIREK